VAPSAAMRYVAIDLLGISKIGLPIVGFTANIVSPQQSSMPWCRQKRAAKNLSSLAHARPQPNVASKESAVNSGRPDFISAPLLSDALKRKLKLEISSAAAD